jgi:hypothetical protein
MNKGPEKKQKNHEGKDYWWQFYSIQPKLCHLKRLGQMVPIKLKLS